MAQTRVCCLCLTFSNAFKSLFDINGQFNDVYKITVQYFDPMLFNSGKEHISMVVICLECWRHISDFHSYQQYVIRAQSQLNHERPILRVKLDEMIASQDNQSPYNPVSVFDIIQISDKTLSKSNISQDCSQVAVPSSIKTEVFDDSPSDFSSQQNCVSHRRIKVKNDAFISKWKGDLKCIICKEIFASYNLLTLHFHRAHPNEKFHVICCKHKFYNSWQLIAHLRKHNKSERGYIRNKHTVHNLLKCICNYCKKSFKTRSSLKIHKRKVHYNIKLENSTIESSPANNMMEHSKEIQSTYMQDNISHRSIASDDTYEIYEMILNESPEIEESYVSFQNEVPCSSASANHHIQRPNLDIVDKKDEIFICSDNDFNVDQSETSVSHIHETNEYSNSKESKSENEQKILEYDEFIAEWKEYLECPNCEEMFTNYFLLCEHFQNRHPNDKCHIICCESKFDTRSKIVTHLRQFHARINRNIHKCEQTTHIQDNIGCISRALKGNEDIYEVLFEDEEQAVNISYSSVAINDNIQKPALDIVDVKDEIITSSDNESVSNSSEANDMQESNSDKEHKILKLKIHKKKVHYNIKLENLIIEPSPADNIMEHSKEIHSSYMQDNISNRLIASDDTDKIYEKILKESPEKEESNVSFQNEVPCSSASANHIQRANLDFVDKKDKNFICSANDSNVDQSEISVSQINLTNEYINSEESNSENEQKMLAYDECIAEWKEYLECPNCEEMFTNYFLLCEHFQNAHPNDKCHIICCESKFDSRSKIATHLRQFHARINRNIYKCEICGTSFIQYGSLGRHIRIKHGIEWKPDMEWQCTYCKRSFETPSSLKRHKKRSHCNVKSAHIPDNIRYISRASNYDKEKKLLEYDVFIAKWKGDLKCPKCKKIFASYSSLDKHFNIEHPSEGGCYIICCKIVLNDRSHIVEHLRKYHKDPTPFRCDVCGNNFNNELSLESHKRQISINNRTHKKKCW